jgi:hypothetical protein
VAANPLESLISEGLASWLSSRLTWACPLSQVSTLAWEQVAVQARHRSRRTRLVAAEVGDVSEVEVSVAAGVTLIAGGSVFSGFSRSCDAPSALWRSFCC